MSHTFNLVSEPWVPAIDLQGHLAELNLESVLAQAHDLRCVAAPNPLETASILRLLLAVLHRTHDTSSPNAWAEIWNRGCFNVNVLASYWRTWSHRFDLFDPQHPFYQGYAGRDDLNPKQIIEIYPGISTAVHFNHRVVDENFTLTAAESARGLLVSQTFGTGIGVIPSEKISIKASTWNSGQVFLVEGDSLFETLMYNLLRYDDYSPSSDIHKTETDRPNWEADDPYQPRSQPLGYLDYLTWPSRRILLIPVEADGKPAVGQFIDFIGVPPPTLLDPFKFYIKKKKAKPDEEPYFPIKLDLEKALWRNSGVILRMEHDQTHAPASLNWLRELKKHHSLRNPRTRLAAYGMVADKTKVDLFREERVPLPLNYLDESQLQEQESLLAALEAAIKQAEAVGQALVSATFIMAKEIAALLGRKEGENRNKPEKLSSEEINRIEQIQRTLSLLPAYWADLELPFNQLILDLVENPENRIAIQEKWLNTVLTGGRNALAASIKRAGLHPKAIKAGVLADRAFVSALFTAGMINFEPITEGEAYAETNL